jgi:transcriptional regulator with XRE-family HTH domain
LGGLNEDGELFREMRRRSGLTQQEIADRLGISQPAVTQFESGKSSPTLKTLFAFANACGVKLEVSIG